MTMARLAIATGQPVGDLLAAPLSIIGALIAVHEEHTRRQQAVQRHVSRRRR